jgi:SAM-dependent methyltransferase
MNGLSDALQAFIEEAPIPRRSFIAFLRRAAETLQTGQSILDVGAGLSPYRELFAHADYVTCDWEQTSYSPELAVDIVAPADKIPVADGSFDAVLCTQVLEHVTEPSDVLRELHRIIRTGGKLWLTAPLVWYLHEEPHDYFRFTSHGLRYLLSKAGFTEITVEPLNDALSTISQLAHDASFLIGEGGDGFDAERGLIGDTMRKLAELIHSYGNFDTRWIMPLDYAASATK